MQEPLIEFRNFSFQYDAQSEPTLRNINLSIHKGEKILIAGPSGCGKSTIVSCINGLIPFTYKGKMDGSLKIAGQEFGKQSIPQLSNIIGTVLQDSDAQFIGLTVLEDIAFSLENECKEKDEMLKIVHRTAKIVEVEDLLGMAPGNLSGGQKQRVSIAGIMVDDVDVMVFDEPLANLDPATGKIAMELIDDVAKKLGVAVIIIEHRLEDVLHISMDRIVLMKEGEIIFDDTPAKLLSSELLTQGGIREPLYITALKYAGVTITEEIKPEHIRSILLSDEMKDKVRKWYHTDVRSDRVGRNEDFLTLENITFAYDGGRTILKNVSTSIKKGELVALVGKNGAGKSTLSKVICGFEKLKNGNILISNEDIASLSIKERADRIGYVMQNPNKMISKIMIYDEVSLGLIARGYKEDEIKERVDKVLKICGLYEFRNWPISALSYGQKKRVTIASILVLDPDMLILDEPTAGQDFHHYTEIMEFLKELNESGLTILMITHDMHLMLEYAERSIVFFDGSIIADNTSAQILTDPDIVERARLKETSLYDLALCCEIDDPSDFAQHFIDYDRTVRC